MGHSSDKSIGRRFREALRVRRDLSQVELAKSIGATAGAVSQWLSGTKQPSRENLKAAANVLAVDPEWLEYGSGAGPRRDAQEERKLYLSQVHWRSRPSHPDGGRDYGNSNMESFDPDLATMVREAIQNVLDQIIDAMGKVVFRIIRLRGRELEEFKKAVQWDDLNNHLQASAEVPQRHGRLLKAALDEFERREELLLLVVEDSGTTGLKGEEEGGGNFAALARNNLDSSKSSSTAGGAFGLGKGTWWRTSQFFTVLLHSDLSEPTEAGKQDNRIIGRCELPWHKHEGEASCAGPAWFGVVRKKGGIEVAESSWDNATLAKDLYMERDASVGPGLTLCVVGFHDPSSDEVKDARRLGLDIEEAVAQYFWPAIATGKLSVWVETWEGRERKTSIEVDVAAREPEFVDALAKLGGQDLKEQLNAPGDTVKREIQLKVPARVTSDGKHDAFEHKTVLLVRRSDEESAGNWNSHLAVYRGTRMVVEYIPLNNHFHGAVPFHAALMCGLATSEGEDLHASRADRFLRTAEPPAHNKWTMTPDLKAAYARGSKRAIEDMLNIAIQEIGRLVRPPSTYLDDGPNSLKELLTIGDEPQTPSEKPRLFRPTAMLDTNGRWIVEAKIRVRPDPGKAWKVAPVVVFVSETGGGIPVEWAELEPVNNCTLEKDRLVIKAGVNEARFRGITNPESHPVGAAESAVRVELRNIDPFRRGEA